MCDRMGYRRNSDLSRGSFPRGCRASDIVGRQVQYRATGRVEASNWTRRRPTGPGISRERRCDHPLLLLEDQLKAGNRQPSDSDISDLQKAVRAVLAQSPMNSFMWLMEFTFKRLHGEGADDMNLLRMSYWSGRNEAWIAIRRNRLALGYFPVIARRPCRGSAIGICRVGAFGPLWRCGEYPGRPWMGYPRATARPACSGPGSRASCICEGTGVTGSRRCRDSGVGKTARSPPVLTVLLRPARAASGSGRAEFCRL